MKTPGSSHDNPGGAAPYRAAGPAIHTTAGYWALEILCIRLLLTNRDLERFPAYCHAIEGAPLL